MMMCGELVLMATLAKLPIGTTVRLKDDYHGITHEIYGYTITADGAHMEFRDGGKLDLRNMDRILEVEPIRIKGAPGSFQKNEE